MSATSTRLPRNSNLATAQAAAMPNAMLRGTATAAIRIVSRTAASASGSAMEAR